MGSDTPVTVAPYEAAIVAIAAAIQAGFHYAEVVAAGQPPEVRAQLAAIQVEAGKPLLALLQGLNKLLGLP